MELKQEMKNEKKVIPVLLLLGALTRISAQEKVSPKFEVKLYGFIKLETIYDNSEVAKGDWLLYAYPGDSPQADQSIFTMNARHTRLGLSFQGFVNDSSTV